MYRITKHLLSLALLALVAACGGGGGTTSYQIVFSGTVTGLPSGQQLTLLGTLPTTGQSVPITITQNGTFSSQINLPSGFNLSNSGAATVTISQQPSVGKCTLGFVTTAAIIVNCASVTGAAGLYIGPLTTSTTSLGIGEIFIQNNESYWMVFGNLNPTTSVVTYTGIISGTGSSTTTTYTSTNGVNVNTSPQIVGDTISATYQSLSTFTGSIIENGVSYDLNLASVAAYSFNAIPLLSNLTGTYNLGLVSKPSTTDTITISIGSTGLFSGTTVNGCAITGNVTPMTTGENAYNFSLIFGQAPCVNPSTTQNGTVLQKNTMLGVQLLGGTFNTSLTDATIVIGTKQ